MTHIVEMALVYDQRKLLSYRIPRGRGYAPPTVEGVL